MKIIITCLLCAIVFSQTISAAQAQWDEAGDNYTTGKLSIGTSTINDKLSIEGNGEWHIRLKDNTGGQDWRVGSTGTGWAAGAGKLVITNTNSSTDAALVITPQKNIGIGIHNPSSKFDIHLGTTSAITTGLSLYRNGDPNLGIRLLTGVGDGASYTTWNGGIGSWNSIAFHSTQDGVTRGLFNVRDGSFSLKGNINSSGNATINGNIIVGTNPGGISTIGGPAYSGAIEIKTNGNAGGSSNRYLRLGVRDNNTVFYPVLSISDNQFVGIGTLNPDAKLAVKGTIHAEEVKVDLNVPVPDYVFEKNYDLRTLAEVENYINQNKHLPEVPAAKEMEEKGVNLGEMNMLLLKKVEELTLYVIELKKENEEQQAQLEILKAKP